MMRSAKFFALAALGLLAACDAPQGSLEKARMNFGVADPTPQAFRVCGDIGCQKRVDVALTQSEWREVRAPFARRPRSAGEERKALAEALRRIELIVGKKTGYDTDEAYSSLQLSGNSQDCVDEMVNAAVYLALIDEAGLMRYHVQGQRVTIGLMTRRFWTHTVSSIFQKDNGQEFIIDTWAVKVGQTPYVMDRKAWAANEPFRYDF